MEPSTAIRFDEERVARPLSERGHVVAGSGTAAPASPAEQIEHSERRLAGDLVAARARFRGAKSEAEHAAWRVAVAAVAVLALGSVVAAAVSSRRKRRRVWW